MFRPSGIFPSSMTGPAQSLFVPLSLAVGFSMGASYLLSSSLVPVFGNWILKQEKNYTEQSKESRFVRFCKRFQRALGWLMGFPKLLLAAYLVVALLIVVLLGPRLAEEIRHVLHSGNPRYSRNRLHQLVGSDIDIQNPRDQDGQKANIGLHHP